MNIEKIPIEELEKDREESLIDINVCESALRVGITAYSTGTVQERLEINKKIVEKITNEIMRRSK